MIKENLSIIISKKGIAILLKLSPGKLEPCFVLWSFFLQRLLCISINLPYWLCTKHCCHVWAGSTSCYLEMLDKIQKQIFRAVGSSPKVSLEPLAHCWNVASLSLFCQYLVDVHLKWLNWFYFHIFMGGLVIILIDCMIFLPSFLDVTKMSRCQQFLSLYS